MHSFLVEIYSEEIPATMQSMMLSKMQAVVAKMLLSHQFIKCADALTVDITPCRIVFISHEIDLQYAADYAIQGPKKDAPPEVVRSFAAKYNINVDDLIISVDRYLHKPMVDLSGVHQHISKIMHHAMQKLSLLWPKRMRWNATGVEWIRPIRSIIFLLDDHIVPFEFAGIHSDNTTFGNKNITKGQQITIDQVGHYIEILRKHGVLLAAERRENIISAIRKLEEQYKFACRYDDLIDEVVGLCEYPLVIMDDIPSQYLKLPHCALIATINRDQRYFTVHDLQRELLPYYIFVAESKESNIDIIRSGNHKVLCSRLSDAQFFFEKDQQYFTGVTCNLAVISDLLSHVPFLSGIGTMYDRVVRLQDIARKLWQIAGNNLILKQKLAVYQATAYQEHNDWIPEKRTMRFDYDNLPTLQLHWHTIAQQDIDLSTQQSATQTEFCAITDSDTMTIYAEQLQQIIQYSKLDLATSIIGEFRELQGQIGGDYAKKFWSLPEEIAHAIRWQYRMDKICNSEKPNTLSIIFGIIDRLDYIVSHFHVKHRPTNSGDPFALRRARNEICALATMNYHFDVIINLPLTKDALSQLVPQQFAYLAAEISSFILKGFEDINHAILSTWPKEYIKNVRDLAELIYQPVVSNGWVFITSVLLPLYKRICKLTEGHQKPSAHEPVITGDTETNIMQEALQQINTLAQKATYMPLIISTVTKLSNLMEHYLNTYIVNHEDQMIKNTRMLFLESLIRKLEEKFVFLPYIR